MAFLDIPDDPPSEKKPESQAQPERLSAEFEAMIAASGERFKAQFPAWVPSGNYVAEYLRELVSIVTTVRDQVRIDTLKEVEAKLKADLDKHAAEPGGADA